MEVSGHVCVRESSRMRSSMFARLHMSMLAACEYKRVCLPGSAPRLGGRAGSKELSSASVPQDTLQLSPRGHEKQSEPSLFPWTYLCL